MRRGARIGAVALCLAFGCTAADDAGPTTSTAEQALTDAVRHARLTTIRDVAAEMGLHNAALLGGVATSETGLAHCYSEAPSACAGPVSPDCAGGAVIAGGGDGACSLEQGGLGMFQFDAGTYAQTLAAYGDSVLTVDGNAALAVSFVVGKAESDIAGVGDWASATAWMDSVPMSASAPEMQAWAHLMACRYNGCCSTSATCVSRGNGYRDNALAVYAELGSDFWATADRCAALPADGVIDTRTACYLAAGDPRFWRRETTAGYGGGLEWTVTTAAAAASNYAEWRIRPGRAGRFLLETYVDGGAFAQSRTARYEVHHGAAVDVVVVDQSAGSGFVPLGMFDFTGDPAADERVRLGDNTGEAGSTMTHLAFDALRVTPADGRGDPTMPDAGTGGGEPGGGGCAAGGAGLGLGLALGLLLLARRR